MIVVLIRTLRPYVPVLVVCLWVSARLVVPQIQQWSLLDTLIQLLAFCKDYSLQLASNSHWAAGYVPIVTWLWHAMEDFLALTLLAILMRLLYCAYHVPLAEWKTKWMDGLFHWSCNHIPGIEANFDKMACTMLQQANIDVMIGKDPKRIATTTLPAKGWGPDAVLSELQPFSKQENDKWTHGKLSGTVYQGDPQHTHLMNQVFALYTWSNPLHVGYWPKLNQCSAEVVQVTANLLHAPQALGSITSGGTESILCAIKASWIYYGKRRGITHPELICGTSAHAAVDKACELMGIRQVRIDCSHGDCRLSPDNVKSCITSNTIMIYASAPTYPQGVIDPIEDLSTLAQQYDVGLHVDACLGGFVLAFWDDAPKFDFQCPGVTSMSIDTHKYGYAAKGTSVVLYRHKKLRHAQYFCYSKWSGGIYATPTLAGSRPGALEVCAWAALMSIGHDGYKERVQTITSATQQIAKGVQQIPGLVVVTENPSMVVCFTTTSSSNSANMDIYSIGSRMSKKGWVLNDLQNPSSLHLCVTLNVATQAETFLKELKDAVAEELAESTTNKTKKGGAGIYGMAAGIPKGPTNSFLQEFVDHMLAP